MPTPFYHLALTEMLLIDNSLPATVRERLHVERAAFLFGNVAPDVQTVSGQDRAATHFFTVPLRDRTPAHETLFARHPELSRVGALAPAHAAFMAGYLCHLMVDQLWIWEILQPFFGLAAAWGELRERLFLHNVMRVYLDRIDRAELSAELGDGLRAAQPEGWLPFVGDDQLAAWRDFLAGQLVPGASIRTVQVFAERMGRAPREFEEILDSEEALAERLWTHIGLGELEAFRARALAKSIELLQSYFDGQLAARGG